MSPKKISIKEKQFLNIKWDDDSESEIKLSKLRSHCPCATCISEKEKYGKRYIPLYSGNEIAVAKLDLIGHYALGVAWKDGHNTGIYEFEHLQRLAK